jgi:site-specific recombinase XerD
VAVRTKDGRHTVEFMFRGVRVFRRLPKGRTKGEAHALEARIRSELFHHVDLGREADPLVEEVIHAWFGKRKDDKLLSHANAVLSALDRHYRLSEVSVLRDRLVSLWEKTLAPGTINRRLSVLKASAKFAKRKKLAPVNHSAEIELVPEPAYTRREISPEMAFLLIEKASTPRARALIAGSAFTGMRLSEVLRFDPAKDIESGAIRVLGKNGEERLIPILPELLPHLNQFPMSKSGWRNVYRGFESARKRSGLKIRYHDLRHMAATAMTNAGIDLRTVGDILGHKTVQTTRKYTHPSLERKMDALRSITAGLQRPKRKAKKKPRK